jgi:hypothetical protein
MDLDPDADPDPAIFVIDLQDAKKKIFVKKKFFCLVLYEGTFTSFSKRKSLKEGSGSGSRAGSIPLTNGSGSRRPKNMWIRWIRIRKTGFHMGVGGGGLKSGNVN